MSKSDSLFQLVSSLTKHEKKFFRQFASMRGGEKKYLLLFDAMVVMRSYDEKRLRARLSGENFLKQLPVAKNYLSRLILKSLRLFHTSSSLDTLLSEELRNVEILYSRGLFQQASAHLKRAYALALQNEKHLRQFELMQWKRKLVRISGYLDFDEEQLGLEQRDRITLTDNLINTANYEELSDAFFLLTSKTNYFQDEKKRKAFKRISSDPRLKNADKAITYKSKYVFNQLNARIQHVSGNARQALHFGQQQIKLIESLPERLFEEERYNYLIALYNQLILLNELNNSTGFIETLKKVRSVKTLSEKEGLAVFYTCMPECDFLLRSKNFAVLPELEKRIVLNLKKYSGKVNVQITFGLYFSMASLFLQSGQPRNAIQWINRILSQRELSVREDISCMAHVLLLLAHYELGHFEILPGLSSSAERFLKSRNAYGENEKLLLHVFGKRLYDAVTIRKRRRVLDQFRKEVLILGKKEPTAYIFSMFDFVYWIDRVSTKIIH